MNSQLTPLVPPALDVVDEVGREGMSRRAEKRLPERIGRYRAVGGAQVSFVSLQNFVQILYGNSLPPSVPSLRRDQRDGLGGQHGAGLRGGSRRGPGGTGPPAAWGPGKFCAVAIFVQILYGY